MSEYTEKMEKAIEATEREFSKIRAGQASPAILNDVRVDYYGTPTPISQVAKISVPEPRMLLVTPWEKPLVDTIEKAILAANIGVTPMKDGNCIRVSLPILTSERRQELAKVARKHASRRTRKCPRTKSRSSRTKSRRPQTSISQRLTPSWPKRKRTFLRCSPGRPWQTSLDM